jgi:hypothetical protein
MPIYTPTTWVNGTTPASAANMNNIETGVAAAVPKDGSDPMTAALHVTQTLGGTNHSYADFTATDGKRYQLIINTSGKIVIFNVTDSVNVAEFGPAAGQITANSQTVWTAANDGSGSGLDADLLDGINSTGFVQFGTGGQKTGFKDTMGNALPVSGMSKGDRHTLTPFVLP